MKLDIRTAIVGFVSGVLGGAIYVKVVEPMRNWRLKRKVAILEHQLDIDHARVQAELHRQMLQIQELEEMQRLP